MSRKGADTRAAGGGRASGPASKPTARLGKQQSAASALAELVEVNAAVVRACERGVLADRDIEPLHDLRVSVRRLRTLLRSARGWVEDTAPELAPRLAEARERLRGVGRATGALRDLDVLLQQLREEGGPAGELERIFEARRGGAAAQLAAVIGSPDWQALHACTAALCLQARTLPPRPGTPTAAEWAERSIRRARRRLLRDNKRTLQPRVTAAALHRVRIDAKRLRYLLELFGSLCESYALIPLVRDLAQLQSELGAFHDAEVQLRLLAETGPELGRAASRRCEARARRHRKQSLRACRQMQETRLDQEIGSLFSDEPAS